MKQQLDDENIQQLVALRPQAEEFVVVIEEQLKKQDHDKERSNQNL